MSGVEQDEVMDTADVRRVNKLLRSLEIDPNERSGKLAELDASMKASRKRPNLREPKFDENQDAVRQMLEASAAKPTLLGS